MNITIVGAGLTGLIAAHIFQQAKIIEAEPRENFTPHRALLRFRSNVVSEATGIPFRKVTVRKGIFYDGQYVAPDIRMANAYSTKCTGRFLPRSIWNVEPAERWIAPTNFAELMLANVAGRVTFGERYKYDGDQPVINTAPLSILARKFGGAHDQEFHYSRVNVLRLTLPFADVHQTVYFPGTETPIYRASITGNVLILEAISEIQERDLKPVCEAMLLPTFLLTDFEESSQRFGKIAPVDDDWRRAFIATLSSVHGIYSLGRFGTWRNILLDDVVHDCAVIKRLMLADAYTRRIAAR